MRRRRLPGCRSFPASTHRRRRRSIAPRAPRRDTVSCQFDSPGAANHWARSHCPVSTKVAPRSCAQSCPAVRRVGRKCLPRCGPASAPMDTGVYGGRAVVVPTLGDGALGERGHDGESVDVRGLALIRRHAQRRIALQVLDGAVALRARRARHPRGSHRAGNPRTPCRRSPRRTRADASATRSSELFQAGTARRIESGGRGGAGAGPGALPQRVRRAPTIRRRRPPRSCRAADRRARRPRLPATIAACRRGASKARRSDSSRRTRPADRPRIARAGRPRRAPRCAKAAASRRCRPPASSTEPARGRAPPP